MAKQKSDLQRPLLEKDDDGGGFSNAGMWSKLTFRWLNPVLEMGRAPTQKLHLPNVAVSETAEKASCLLQESLQKQQAASHPHPHPLPIAIALMMWPSLSINALFAGVNTVASYMGPYLIIKFVNLLSQKKNDISTSFQYGIVLALLFFLSKTVESLSQRQWYFGARRIGIRLRSALTVLIYKNSLSSKFSTPGDGRIINLVSEDADRIGDFCWNFHSIWLLPLQVTLALVILHQNLGAAPALAAVLSTVLIMASNTPLTKVQERVYSKIMEAKDSRLKATSETLKSMRVLKLHCWEPIFLHKILRVRESERRYLKRYLYTCSAVAFLFWASPTLVSILTFGVCILMGTPLTTASVLSALATFQILQEPIYNLPDLINMIAQTKVSLRRLQDLIVSEHTHDHDHHLIEPNCDNDVVIEIARADYDWDERNKHNPTIRVCERRSVVKGEKVAVCGTVGSGKSSLLSSILGEIPRICGEGVKVYGSKAYVPQTAWIQTGTVRDNVLFGKEMNEAFYKNVLRGCALDREIEMWENGDLSVVGEKGINLSGGQKQRIQLARAVYNDSDVYVLDDPFSAVDAHTGAHLFKECLMKLLADKTVVYATHQLKFLDGSDLVLVMRNGRIVESGKYKDLVVDEKGELVNHMAAHRKSLKHVNKQKQVESSSTSENNAVEAKQEKPEKPTINSNVENKNLEEESGTGRVNWKVYWTFVTSAYKGALVPLLLVCQLVFQGLQMGSNYWIAWATSEQGKASVSDNKLIGVFMIMSGGSSIFILIRGIVLATLAIKTAQHLFLGMIQSVFRAPISFFDSTPLSRILSRSSTDQKTVDTDIPYRVFGLVFAIILLLSIIILMCQVAWQVFPLFLAILAISIWYQAYYMSTARELARMVGVRKAPILHHFSESVAGAAMIRCFKQQERFHSRNLRLIDDYSRVCFHNYATMEWLSVRINFLFNIVFFVVLIILLTLPASALDPSLAGLVATYGLNLHVVQAWVIWNLCNVEDKMISVERILEFTNITTEAPLVMENSKPSSEWPAQGKIELQDVHMRYAPHLPLILKGLTCTFPGGTNVGIVGRTGSGKSTLIQALFRMIELSRGRILIDGVDICKIGLHDLRSRLGIIPQDPTLFEGSVRTNIDPVDEHSDWEIWEVINKCPLADMVRKDHRLLDAPVSEDGANWSVGQKQLMCLARLLLRRNRIVVLDEATASVDSATDSEIQRAIREERKGCTILTVAHRIPTVIDNDLVLLLDQGNILEYDSPHRLLKDGSSAFSNLVNQFTNRQ